MALANLRIYYTWKNITSAYNKNKFKFSVPTLNDEFDLPDGSYSLSDIQDYFQTLSKSMKLQQTILPCKFTPVKPKIGMFLK